MKAYVQFFQNGKEAMGSDSVHVLDARLNRPNMIAKAMEQRQRLQAVKPCYNGFQIRIGNLKNYRVAFSFIPVTES